MHRMTSFSAESCYICNINSEPIKRRLTDTAEHSGTPIFEILETFAGRKLKEVVLEKVGVCQVCFLKFNEYDKYLTLAERIRIDLMEVFRPENDSDLILIKSEIKEEPDSYNHNFDENSPKMINVEVQIEEIVKKVTKKRSAKNTKLSSRSEAKSRSLSKALKPRKLTLKTAEEASLKFSVVDGVKHYQCDICGKHLPSLPRFRHHKQMHATERNFNCDICTASFKTRECVTVHKSSAHKNVFLTCDLCPAMTFRKKHSLRSHMDAIHLGRKDHICPYCGKAFGLYKNLWQHMYNHTKQRDIVCEVCGFKALNKTKMNRHMKTHTGEKNYECEICGKRFALRYNVTAHRKQVHDRVVRPTVNHEKLTCTVCGQKFQRICTVKQHMIKVHKIVEETDKLLSIGFL